MRKHWLALLSMIGMAGSTLPAQAQVLKGSKDESTNKQQKIKASKTAQEKAAAKVELHDKWKKNAAETNAAASQATIKGEKNASANKATKSAAEIKATKNVVNEKATKAGQTKQK